MLTAFLPAVHTVFNHSTTSRLRECSMLMLAYGRNALMPFFLFTLSFLFSIAFLLLIRYFLTLKAWFVHLEECSERRDMKV